MVDLWSDARVSPMTADDAETVATWRYGGPWAVYELPSAQPLLDDLADYYSVTSGQVLIGFFCTGAAARVPGMVEDPTVVDVGLGLHPDHVGRRRGALFARIVLKHLSEVHPGRPLRAVVQAWNRRSLRLTHQLGFVDIGEMTTVQNGKPVAYRIVMTS